MSKVSTLVVHLKSLALGAMTVGIGHPQASLAARQ
jgi:hypothetical protein